MCQSGEDSELRSKMVEELDEVKGLQSVFPPVFSSVSTPWSETVCLCVLQVSGLQYKKFLAFPWILTVTWPLDTVSRTSCFLDLSWHLRLWPFCIRASHSLCNRPTVSSISFITVINMSPNWISYIKYNHIWNKRTHHPNYRSSKLRGRWGLYLWWSIQ